MQAEHRWHLLDVATGEFVLKLVENRKAPFSARFCIYLERRGKGWLE